MNQRELNGYETVVWGIIGVPAALLLITLPYIGVPLLIFYFVNKHQEDVK